MEVIRRTYASITGFKNPETGKFAVIHTFNNKILVVSDEVTAEFKGVEGSTIAYNVEYIGYSVPQEAYDLLNSLGYTLSKWPGSGGVGITLE